MILLSQIVISILFVITAIIQGVILYKIKVKKDLSNTTHLCLGKIILLAANIVCLLIVNVRTIIMYGNFCMTLLLIITPLTLIVSICEYITFVRVLQYINRYKYTNEGYDWE